MSWDDLLTPRMSNSPLDQFPASQIVDSSLLLLIVIGKSIMMSRRRIRNKTLCRLDLLKVLWSTLLFAAFASASIFDRVAHVCENSKGVARVGITNEDITTQLWVEWEKQEQSLATDNSDDDDDAMVWKPTVTTTTVRHQFQLHSAKSKATINATNVVCLYAPEEKSVWVSGTLQQADESELVWIQAIDIEIGRAIFSDTLPMPPHMSLQALELVETSELRIIWKESNNTASKLVVDVSVVATIDSVPPIKNTTRRLFGIVTLAFLCCGVIWAFSCREPNEISKGTKPATRDTDTKDTAVQNLEGASIMDTSLKLSSINESWGVKKLRKPSLDQLCI